jgi:hypothetical protein
MNQGLLNSKDYCVFTFVSTSQALKAEKVLKENDSEFIIMPTLREISSSCGLSIKITPEHLDEYKKTLEDSQVVIEGIYRINKENGKNEVKKLEH